MPVTRIVFKGVEVTFPAVSADARDPHETRADEGGAVSRHAGRDVARAWTAIVGPPLDTEDEDTEDD